MTHSLSSGSPRLRASAAGASLLLLLQALGVDVILLVTFLALTLGLLLAVASLLRWPGALVAPAVVADLAAAIWLALWVHMRALYVGRALARGDEPGPPVFRVWTPWRVR